MIEDLLVGTVILGLPVWPLSWRHLDGVHSMQYLSCAILLIDRAPLCFDEAFRLLTLNSRSNTSTSGDRQDPKRLSRLLDGELAREILVSQYAGNE